MYVVVFASKTKTNNVKMLFTLSFCLKLRFLEKVKECQRFRLIDSFFMTAAMAYGCVKCVGIFAFLLYLNL